MTMSRVGSPNTDKDQCQLGQQQQCDSSYFDFSQVEQSQQKPVKCQPSKRTKQQLSEAERIIIEEVDKCFINWYKPWKETYLANGLEFGAIFNLMESLIHYQEQIQSNEFMLPTDRLNAIAKAITRLIDHGNAILNIDMILRSDDGTFREMDPLSMTTIELHQAHIKAHGLREKLLNDYFKNSRKKASADGESPTANLTVPQASPSSLRMPINSGSNLPSPVMDRSQRCSVGSTNSINTLIANGQYGEARRTPQALNRSLIEVRTQSSTEDLTESELEKRHLIATLRSDAFRNPKPSTIRVTLLQSALVKIEKLCQLTGAEKLNDCFDLLDELLNSIERIPDASRKEEVQLLANSLLMRLARKIYVDDRDHHVHFQRSHWATYLISVIRMMSETDFKTYVNNFSNLSDLSAFLKEYLFVIQKFISRPSETDSHLDSMEPIFPECWIEMTLLASSTLLKSLIFLNQILRSNYASNTQLRHSYIDCLLYFVLQDVLKPNRPMLKQRQKLLADDLLKTSAEYVWIAWDSLNGNQKYQILEDIIEPLLKVCITLNGHKRAILLSIFFDMMQCDYAIQYVSERSTICGDSSATSQATFDSQLNYIYELEQEQRTKATSTCNGPIADSVDGSAQRKSKFPTSMPSNSSHESLPYLDFAHLTRHKQTTGRTSASDDGTVLTKFTHLIVGKLYDIMVVNNLGDEEFKNDLCSAISGELSGNYNQKQSHNSTLRLNSTGSASEANQFKCMAKHTANLISEFIQICLDSRQANKLHYNHLHLLCLFKLILFFRDKVDRIKLYLRNLHKLWCLHHNAGRFVEAGFTLLELANSLPWSNNPLEGHYSIITRSFQSNQPLSDYTQLKLFLYTTIIEYFDQAQLWEAAVPLCRQLIDIYQFKLFDYGRLAGLHSKLAQFFTNISNGNLRSHPEYFRVTFYGCGFPHCLRNSTLIYRGKPFEKLADFQATLLNKYPDAKLLTTLEQPAESLLEEADAKYLQINACRPVFDVAAKFSAAVGSTEVLDTSQLHDPILDYYKHNECDKFEFSRRLGGAGDDFANMWLQRITLTTNSLPGMLPFFIVFLQETRIISPIECAIEVMERSNDGLSRMVNRFRADKRHEENVQQLCQMLTGIVLAAVNGGISKYEEAFFTGARGVSATATPKATTTHSNDQTQVPLSLLTSEPTSSAAASARATQQAGGSEDTCANNTAASTISSASQSTLDQSHGVGADKCAPANRANERPHVLPAPEQMERLKRLIAAQVPLLDEAIRLHAQRLDDAMRPQHELLELSYKRLKNHIMSKYARYLPDKWLRNSTSSGHNTLRSYRSLARSPNRSGRSESASVFATTSSVVADRSAAKRVSDVGHTSPVLIVETSDELHDRHLNQSNIPYEQLRNERRSLPFLPPTGPVLRNVANRKPSPPSHLTLDDCVGSDEPDFVPPPPSKDSIYAYQNYAPQSTYVALSEINTQPPVRPVQQLRSSTPTKFSEAPHAHLLQNDNGEEEVESEQVNENKKGDNDDAKLVII